MKIVVLKNIKERGSYPLEIRLEMMDTKMMKEVFFILQKEQEDYKVNKKCPYERDSKSCP